MTDTKTDSDQTPEEPVAVVLEEPARVEEAPVAARAPAVEEAPQARRGGVLAPLAGGALAAALGFGLSHFDVFGLRPVADDSAVQAVAAKVATLEADLARVTGEAEAGVAEARAAAAAAVAPLAAVPEAVAALGSRVDALDAALAKASGEGGSPVAVAGLAAEVEALKAAVAAVQSNPAEAGALRAVVQEELAAWEAAAAEKLRAEAAAQEAAVARAAAIAGLEQALVTGAPFAAALGAFGPGEVPESVSNYAETGLPTVASLTEGFAEPARAALEAALRAEAGEGLMERVWSFLRIQTGARSLTPREGTDADAVLSRAEAAVKAGDVEGALAELAALPAPAQEALAGWTAKAQDHLAAAAAIRALAGP